MQTAVSKHFLIYRFNDSSTPPDYHRSYTICVTSGKVDFSIDVYGKIVCKKLIALSNAAYQSFLSAILELNIKNQDEPHEQPCTGGTSDYLEIIADRFKEVSGHTFHCGGSTYGNLQGDVAKAVKLFQNLVPDLQRKMNASRK